MALARPAVSTLLYMMESKSDSISVDGTNVEQFPFKACCAKIKLATPSVENLFLDFVLIAWTDENTRSHEAFDTGRISKLSATSETRERHVFIISKHSNTSII